MSVDYCGKKVFITGASRGIGKVICNMYEEGGAYVCAPSREELDLSQPCSVENYLEQNSDKEYDILIFCAGVNNKSSIESIEEQNLHETFQVNLFSSIEIIKKYIKKMRSKNMGKIIFISSLYAFVSREERLSYCCSKNAITGLVKTLALEGAPNNICVNAVAPGYVYTEMTEKNLSENELENIRNLIPMSRLQEATEIADAVAFLSSDKNKSITGQILAVDGGFLCR